SIRRRSETRAYPAQCPPLPTAEPASPPNSPPETHPEFGAHTGWFRRLLAGHPQFPAPRQSPPASTLKRRADENNPGWEHPAKLRELVRHSPWLMLYTRIAAGARKFCELVRLFPSTGVCARFFGFLLLFSFLRVCWGVPILHNHGNP